MFLSTKGVYYLMKILTITGIRSDYDILFPVLKALESGGHQIQIVASGAHLSDTHNFTERKIIADGFDIVDRIDSLLSTDRLVQRSKGVGMLTIGLSQTVERVKPDMLLMLGDREESIATAIVGNYMSVLVAHIGGGDPVYGNADDPMRFAVSKLAHLHLCTAAEYAQNLRNIGEEDFRIHWTGNPALVNIAKTEQITLKSLAHSLNLPIDHGRYVVLIKHPLSSEVQASRNQMHDTLLALKEFCRQQSYHVVCIQPNSDPGSEVMRHVIAEFSEEDWLHPLNTLGRVQFVNLMRHTKALIGNSSMGILEAPFYKLPVVNVGNRQRGRLNAGNVEFVSYALPSIVSSVEKACLDENYRHKVRNLSNPYGDASAAEKVRIAIESVDLADDRWYTKVRLCP